MPGDFGCKMMIPGYTAPASFAPSIPLPSLPSTFLLFFLRTPRPCRAVTVFVSVSVLVFSMLVGLLFARMGGQASCVARARGARGRCDAARPRPSCRGPRYNALRHDVNDPRFPFRSFRDDFFSSLLLPSLHLRHTRDLVRMHVVRIPPIHYWPAF